jgi:uncharacterized protein DUF2267
VGAQLPPLLRGLYYEGWHSGRAATIRRSTFLDRIHDGVHRDPAVDAEEVARSVLALLQARLPAAEIEDAKAAPMEPLMNKAGQGESPEIFRFRAGQRYALTSLNATVVRAC